MALTNFAGELLGGKLWFGKYPSDREVAILEREGFTDIINLCTQEEITWTPYTTVITVTNYPFEDGTSQNPQGEVGRNPSAWTGFLPFIQTLVNLVNLSDTKVYIHCKGGHGRSPTICAIICGVFLALDSEVVLKMVHAAHQKRRVMDPKWRRLGAPQRAKQKRLVVDSLTTYRDL